MNILKADYDDLQMILELQFLSYQSEAKLLNNYEIPPLKQTLSEIQNEYENGIILKAVGDCCKQSSKMYIFSPQSVHKLS